MGSVLLTRPGAAHGRSPRSIDSRRSASASHESGRASCRPRTRSGSSGHETNRTCRTEQRAEAAVAERLVVDASAVLAILRAEPDAADVRRALAAPNLRELHVPDHFWLEVVNVLVRRYGHSTADVAEAVRELDELGLLTASIDRPLLLLALDAMSSHDLSAYDAAYLALSIAVDADLLTLGASLATAAGDRSALRSDADVRISEIRAGYGREPLAAWAGLGQYIATLRERSSSTSG